MSAPYDHCGKWERGLDCAFNFYDFYFITSIIWALTIIPLVYKAVQRGWNAATGATTWCLFLTAISASFSLVDALLFLIFGEEHAHPYHLHMLTYVGSVFLVFALSLFAGLWCNLASALHSKVIHPPVPVKSLRTIRFGYIAIAIVHVPFAALKAIADVKEELGLGMIRRDEISVVWSIWSFASSCCALTFFSFLMARVARNLGKCPNSEGFRMVTWVNFGEQIIYDGCLAAIAILYYWGTAYNDHGLVQAGYYALYFLLYWSMHAQVLVFFIAVPKGDALYAKANDVVGRSQAATAVVRRKLADIEDISFSWEGGKDINVLFEEAKLGIYSSSDPGLVVDSNISDLRNRGRGIEEWQNPHAGLNSYSKPGDAPAEFLRESEEDDDPLGKHTVPLEKGMKPTATSSNKSLKLLASLPRLRLSSTPTPKRKDRVRQVCECGTMWPVNAKFCSYCGAKHADQISTDLEEGVDEMETIDASSKPLSISLPRETYRHPSPRFDVDEFETVDAQAKPLSISPLSSSIPQETYHPSPRFDREPEDEEDFGVVGEVDDAKYSAEMFVEVEDDVPDEIDLDEYVDEYGPDQIDLDEYHQDSLDEFDEASIDSCDEGLGDEFDLQGTRLPETPRQET